LVFNATGMVLPFTVVGSIVSLNVRTILLVTGTPVAPAAGFTLTTVGCVVFATLDVPVVKLLVNGVTTFPA